MVSRNPDERNSMSLTTYSTELLGLVGCTLTRLHALNDSSTSSQINLHCWRRASHRVFYFWRLQQSLRSDVDYADTSQNFDFPCEFASVSRKWSKTVNFHNIIHMSVDTFTDVWLTKWAVEQRDNASKSIFISPGRVETKVRWDEKCKHHFTPTSFTNMPAEN